MALSPVDQFLCLTLVLLFLFLILRHCLVVILLLLIINLNSMLLRQIWSRLLYMVFLPVSSILYLSVVLLYILLMPVSLVRTLTTFHHGVVFLRYSVGLC